MKFLAASILVVLLATYVLSHWVPDSPPATRVDKLGMVLVVLLVCLCSALSLLVLVGP